MSASSKRTRQTLSSETASSPPTKPTPPVDVASTPSGQLNPSGKIDEKRLTRSSGILSSPMEQTASRSKHPLEKLHHDAGEGIFNGTSPLSSISGSPPEFSPMDKAKWAAAAAAAISLSNAATAANTSVSLPSNLASAVTAKLVTGSAKRSLFSKTTDYEEEGDDEDEEDDDNDNDNEENGPPGHLGRPLSTSLSPGSSRAPHRANSSSPGKQNSMSPERSRMSMMDSSAHMPTQARSVSAGPSLGTLTSRSSSLSPPPNDEGGSDMSVDRVKRRRSASTGEDMLQSTANTSDAEVDGKKKDDDEMDENENEDEYNNERRTRRQIRARSARRPRSDNNKGTVHVPSNLLNPFKIMDKGITSKTSYSSFFYSPGEQSFKQAWMDEVMQDVNEISSEVKNLDKLSPGRRPRLSKKTAEEEAEMQLCEEEHVRSNDDHCSACLQKGKLLCCDSCPKAFHPACTEEAFNIDQLPEGTWNCRACVRKQDRASNPIIRLSLKRAKLSPGFEDRLFEKLHYDMDGMNPRIFELPIELREYFDHTWTHPSTGAYVDTSRYEVSQVSARGTRGKSGSRMNSSSNISKPSESTRARTASAQNFSLRLRDGNSDALSQQQQQPSIPLCYKCGKSGNKLYNPNFLTSTSVKKSQSSQSVSKLTSQIDRSPIIACEFCDLYWHLDCLDPPLTSPPADLNADTEIVDADQARNLKRKAWGVQLARESDRGELPSDPNQPKENLFDQEGGVAANNSGDGSVGFSGLVKIPVVGNTISTSSSAYDLQVAEDGSARTSKLGLLQIRRKWMCPCHADWVLPRQRIGRRWKWIELNENGDVVMREPTSTKIVDIDEPTGSSDPVPVETSSDPVVANGSYAMDETFHPSSSIPASSPAAPGPPAGALAMSVSPVAGGGGPSSRSNVSNSNIDFERILKGKTNYVDIDIKNENDGNNSITSINVSMVQDLIASYTLSPPRRSTTKPPTEAVMTLSQALARSIFYEIDGIKFRLPEKKIKLDFLSRVNSMKDLRDGSCFGPGRILFDENGELILDEKVLSQLPAGIGQEYTSHIEELFGGGGGDDDEATRTAATTTSTLSSSSTTVIVENHQQAAAAGRGGGNVAAKLLLAADVLGSVEHLPRVEAPKKRLRCSDEEADEWLTAISKMQEEIAERMRKRKTPILSES